MWPFKRKTQPDPLLGEVQHGVVASIGMLFQQIEALRHQLRLTEESATAARAMETRLHKIDALATSTRNLLETELSRIDSAVVQVRGLATGGSRGAASKRNRDAEEVGEKFLASIQDPERLRALIAELTTLAGAGGHTNGSPVAGVTDRAALGAAMVNGG